MSAYSMTVFLEPRATARGSAGPHPVLYIEPDHYHGPGCITLQIHSKCTPEDRVRIAEALAKGVTEWRDQIVAEAERQRTAADELEAARAEIARLKAEAAAEEVA